MPRGGRRPGAGRKPGIPNRLTSTARSAFLATFKRLEPDLETWIRDTAAGRKVQRVAKDGSVSEVVEGADPGKAADLLIRMAEYHFPKLGRSELVGDKDAPLQIQVVTLGGPDAK